MEAVELLRSQFEMANQFMEMTIADCSQEVLEEKGEGWTINPIGSLYAHVYVAEDMMVNGLVRGVQPVLMSDGWQEKLGMSDPSPFQPEHYQEMKIDLPTFREYAKAVTKATDEFLASASEADLMRELDGPGGKQPALTFLAVIGLTHVAGHWGEIAALKGVQGLRGLPF